MTSISVKSYKNKFQTKLFKSTVFYDTHYEISLSWNLWQYSVYPCINQKISKKKKLWSIQKNGYYRKWVTVMSTVKVEKNLLDKFDMIDLPYLTSVCLIDLVIFVFSIFCSGGIHTKYLRMNR